VTGEDQEWARELHTMGLRREMKILYVNIYNSIKFSSHLIPTIAGKPFPHLGNYRVGKYIMLRIGSSVGTFTEISEVLPCV
jgi:hypothetical protein